MLRQAKRNPDPELPVLAPIISQSLLIFLALGYSASFISFLLYSIQELLDCFNHYFPYLPFVLSPSGRLYLLSVLLLRISFLHVGFLKSCRQCSFFPLDALDDMVNSPLFFRLTPPSTPHFSPISFLFRNQARPLPGCGVSLLCSRFVLPTSLSRERTTAVFPQRILV